MLKNFEVQAHRGASKTAKENTLEAFLKAQQIGCDSIEMDLHLTSDGEVVVMHDFLWQGKPIIQQTSLQGQFLLLKTVFQALKPTIILDLELKRDPAHPDWSAAPKVFVHHLVQLVHSEWKGPVRVRSFDSLLLQELKLQAPKLERVALVEDGASWESAVSSTDPQWIAPYYRSVNAERVKWAHSKGLKVMPYTVNDPATWKTLLSLGVDGITTDDPAALMILKRV